MIWKPKLGQRVEIRYAKNRAHLFPRHGCKGVVCVSGTGQRAVNVLVRLDDGADVIVPRGNLFTLVMEVKGG